MGRAKLEFSGGRTYVGQVQNGKPHGVGLYSWPTTGTTYQGEFAEGRRHGVGRHHNPSTGESLFGLWQNDRLNDTREASVRYANGDSYEGGWFNGRHGPGTFRRADGLIVRGCFCADAEPVSGVLTAPLGARWEGPIRASGPEGLGNYWAPGAPGAKRCLAQGWEMQPSAERPRVTRYTGERQGDQYHGQGQLIFSDGARLSGRFINGQWPQIGCYRCPDGSGQYQGPILNGLPNGRGTCTWAATGLTYSGDVRPDDASLLNVYRRARLANKWDSLRDTANNPLMGQHAILLSCGHVDSRRHLELMTKQKNALLRRGKDDAAAVVYRCGCCRQGIDRGAADHPEAESVSRFLKAYAEAFPAGLDRADDEAVALFWKKVETGLVKLPKANAQRGPVAAQEGRL